MRQLCLGYTFFAPHLWKTYVLIFVAFVSCKRRVFTHVHNGRITTNHADPTNTPPVRISRARVGRSSSRTCRRRSGLLRWPRGRPRVRGVLQHPNAWRRRFWLHGLSSPEASRQPLLVPQLLDSRDRWSQLLRNEWRVEGFGLCLRGAFVPTPARAPPHCHSHL